MFVNCWFSHSHKSEKKPFHRIEGAWNGVMYTKQSEDVCKCIVSSNSLAATCMYLAKRSSLVHELEFHPFLSSLSSPFLPSSSSSIFLPFLLLSSVKSRDVFMDTINTPTVRKKLLKLSAQDPLESRRLWQHVTEALSKGDVDTAAKAKHIVSHSA